MKLWSKLRLGLRLLAFVFGTIACRIGFELGMLFRGKKQPIDVINVWVPRWSGILLWIFGIRVEGHGPQLDGGRLYPGKNADGVGRIFILNHRSGVDIPAMFTLVAGHAISRHDLATWPLIGSGAARIGTLFVDRSSRRSGAAALKQIADVIARGEGVFMFPEGTAYPGDEVHEFKPGAFTTAARTGAEIVPLGIVYDNPDAYYTEQSFMDHMKRVAGLRRLRVLVEAGEPLVVDPDSRVEVKDVAHERVQQLVHRARARLEGRSPSAVENAAVRSG